MNADLVALIRLQKIRDEIAALSARIDGEIPERISELETSLREARERLAASQGEVQEARKERSRLELDLQAAEEKIAKYKAALMQVKNNDEYRAALNEIDYTQRTYGEIESRVLELMEQVDGQKSSLEELEAEVKSEDEKIHVDRATLEGERERLVSKRQALEADAGAIEETLPQRLRAVYTRIASMRGGQGLARAKDGVCAACNVRLRPAVFQVVKRNEDVLTCDSCGRILFWEDEAGEAGSTGNGLDAAKPGNGKPASGGNSDLTAADTAAAGAGAGAPAPAPPGTAGSTGE